MIYNISINFIFPLILIVLAIISFYRFYRIWKTRFDNRSGFLKRQSKFIFKSLIEFFKKEQSLVQTLFVIFSIYISALTFRNNQEQLTITQVALKLSKEQLVKSDSISDLNINLLNSLNNSSSSLLNNMDILSNKISLFPQKIDSITQNLIALNKLINEQKKITENEMKRAPLLSYSNFSIKDNLVSFDFNNTGGISAYIVNIKVIIFNKKTNIFSIFINDRLAEREENNDFVEHSIYFDFNAFRIFQKDSKKITFTFMVDDPNDINILSKSFTVVFRIGYSWIYDKYETFEFNRDLKFN